MNSGLRDGLKVFAAGVAIFVAIVLCLLGGALGLALLIVPVLVIHQLLRHSPRPWAWAFVLTVVGFGAVMLVGWLVGEYTTLRLNEGQLFAQVGGATFLLVAGGGTILVRAHFRRGAARTAKPGGA
jgi:hypothetical protein